MYLVGGGDELGAYDDSQFQDNEGEKKKKSNNVVRKSNHIFNFQNQIFTSSSALHVNV